MVKVHTIVSLLQTIRQRDESARGKAPACSLEYTQATVGGVSTVSATIFTSIFAIKEQAVAHITLIHTNWLCSLEGKECATGMCSLFINKSIVFKNR